MALATGLALPPPQAEEGRLRLRAWAWFLPHLERCGIWLKAASAPQLESCGVELALIFLSPLLLRLNVVTDGLYRCRCHGASAIAFLPEMIDACVYADFGKRVE